MKKAIDVNDLEAQFLQKTRLNTREKVVADEDVIEFNDQDDDEPVVMMESKRNSASINVNGSPVKGVNISYAAATGGNSNNNKTAGSSAMTVEELEAQLSKSLPNSTNAGGPPPGLPPGLAPPSSNSTSNANTAANSTIPSFSDGIITSAIGAPFGASGNNLMSSTAPLPRNDPNREFMNRFERNLIMKIHTTQLTTETPLMDDFYYQALTKKKATMAEGTGPLLYFPLPSTAERERELQRRERRRKQREREKEKEKLGSGVDSSIASTNTTNAAEVVELVLGKISHSTSRKPRQQLQLPSMTDSLQKNSQLSLHEKVMRGIEACYAAILAVEDYYLAQEEEKPPAEAASMNLHDLAEAANRVFHEELALNHESGTQGPNHQFIHFLTIPKGRSVIGRILKTLREDGRERFLSVLVEHFDFLEIVRPETPLQTVDSFIAQVLSPLVAFVGEAEGPIVLSALEGLFQKRSFIWIALTKSGMVLLCILLSRLEILKAALPDESDFSAKAAELTEKMFDSLEGHLIELFSATDSSRDFYAWQFLALLAMNVDSDRKRSTILELRDKILVVVETGDERAVKNLNVFLNALGLDASQLK